VHEHLLSAILRRMNLLLEQVADEERKTSYFTVRQEITMTMTSLKKFIFFSRSLHRAQNRDEVPAGGDGEEEYWDVLELVPMVP